MKLSVILIVIVLLIGCKENSKNNKVKQFAGMYKLYNAENEDSAGVWHEDPWTKGGTGYIIYDGLGHMAVHITPEGYKNFQWIAEEESLKPELLNNKLNSMSTEELKEAVRIFSSSYVYVGNYSIEETNDVVKHQRITSHHPSIWGTTVRRAFSFSGDTVILRILNGNRRLKWIKEK